MENVCSLKAVCGCRCLYYLLVAGQGGVMTGATVASGVVALLLVLAFYIYW